MLNQSSHQQELPSIVNPLPMAELVLDLDEQREESVSGGAMALPSFVNPSNRKKTEGLLFLIILN